MKKRREIIKVFKYLIPLWSLAIATSFAASDLPVYTWKECLEFAIKNNPELSAALSKIQSSEYSKDGQRSNFLPTVSATLTKTNSTSQTQGQAKTSTDAYGVGVNASINLFNGLRDYNLLSQADATIAISKAQYVKTSADILYSLKAAFENYRYAIENTKLAEQILQRRQDNLKLVNLRFEGGLENKGSELLSEAYLSQAEYDLLVAKQSQMTAAASLAQVLGFDTHVKFKITGELETQNLPKNEETNFEVLARSTPTYVEALNQESYYKKSISIAKSGFSPTLSLSGGVNQNANDFLGDQQKGSSIGLTLNIPIFDGGSDYYGIKSASANYAQQRSNRINTERTVAVDLRTKYVEYVQSVALLKTNSTFKNAAEVRAEIARGKYNNGLLSFEDWVIIENDLITRQKSYLTSHRSRVLAEASWYQTLGKGISQ